MFSKKIESIQLKKETAEYYPSMHNYTHFKLVQGGIILTTNKNKAFKIPKLFIKLDDVRFITHF